MKKEVVFCSALLATLAVQGAGFDRAELDKMLDKLGRSEPPTRLAPGATCYAPILPAIRNVCYLCPLCGTRTWYPSEYDLSFIETFRRAAEKLKRQTGLDIRLDARDFCVRCAPEQAESITVTRPVRAGIAENEDLNQRFPDLPPGCPVSIYRQESDNRFRVGIRCGFIHASLIDENGRLLKDAQFRTGPGTSFLSLGVRKAGEQLPRLAAQPDDDPEWVRVEPFEFRCKSWLVPAELLTSVESETQIEWKEERRPKLFWIITIDGNTRRVPIQSCDLELLDAFLHGRDRYDSGRGGEAAVKDRLPRLKALLGTEAP